MQAKVPPHNLPQNLLTFPGSLTALFGWHDLAKQALRKLQSDLSECTLDYELLPSPM